MEHVRCLDITKGDVGGQSSGKIRWMMVGSLIGVLSLFQL
jgi:hypothetical protein